MLEAPPTSQSAFIAHAAQQASYTPGYDRSAMGGMPQLGAANMIVQPLLASLAAQQGQFLGQFSPDGGNFTDLLRAEQYRVEGMRRAAVAAQQVDVDTWISQQAGLMRAIDAPFGLEHQAAFRRTYQAAAPMLSMLGQVAPELVDSLHGSRGSAALMTSGIMRGGQYQFDAIAPGMGISGATADQMQRTIAESLYGSPEATSRMLGVGMGQLGQIYDESARRGLLPGSIAVRSRPEQLQELSRFTGKSQDELSSLDADQLGQQLTKFDTTRTATRLGELARSVSAMRELFGSQGQPNAPMAALLNALENITQNRLASMPAAQVEQLVRRTKNVLETTGVSLDALTGLTAQGAGIGKALGLDPALAMQSAQNAIAFGAGSKNAFGSSFQAFSAFGSEELIGTDMRLRQQAAASEQARFASGVIRTADALGIKGEFGELAAALKRGDLEFKGVPMYEVLRRDKLEPLMAAAPGVTLGDTQALNAVLDDKKGAEENIVKYNLDSLARDQQRLEFTDTIGRMAGETAIMPALALAGLPDEQARNLAATAGPALMDAILTSDDAAGLSTPAGRAAIYTEALEPLLGPALAGRTGPSIALNFESRLGVLLEERGLTIPQLIQTQNKAALDAGKRVTRTAHAAADIDQMLAPLGKAGPIQRVMDLLATAGTERVEIPELVVSMLGGIKADTVRDLFEKQQKLRALRDLDAPTPAQTKEAAAAEKSLIDAVSAIAHEAKEKGVDFGRRIDDEALDKASDVSATAVAEAVKTKKVPEITTALDAQLTRSGNLVQELYTDDKSLRRMGAGGFELAQQAEQQRLQLLRATDGNVELLAKALADDPSIPETERKKIQTLHNDLSASMRQIRNRVSGGPGMDDAAWDVKHKAVEKFRTERKSSDAEQQRTLLDQLATSVGMKPADLADTDRATLAPLLGGVEDRRRLDVSSAIAARDKLATAAKERKTTIEELRVVPEFDDEFAQAGALASLSTDGKADLADLQNSLKGLGPSVKPAAVGGPSERGALELTGTLTLIDGSATISGTGYSR